MSVQSIIFLPVYQVNVQEVELTIDLFGSTTIIGIFKYPGLESG